MQGERRRVAWRCGKRERGTHESGEEREAEERRASGAGFAEERGESREKVKVGIPPRSPR